MENSGDVDLDALLEDLCVMEKDLNADVNAFAQVKVRSPSPSNRRLSSPVKVSHVKRTFSARDLSSL